MAVWSVCYFYFLWRLFKLYGLLFFSFSCFVFRRVAAGCKLLPIFACFAVVGFEIIIYSGECLNLFAFMDLKNYLNIILKNTV